MILTDETGDMMEVVSLRDGRFEITVDDCVWLGQNQVAELISYLSRNENCEDPGPESKVERIIRLTREMEELHAELHALRHEVNQTFKQGVTVVDCGESCVIVDRTEKSSPNIYRADQFTKEDGT